MMRGQTNIKFMAVELQFMAFCEQQFSLPKFKSN
jgi:hypothetical protein